MGRPQGGSGSPRLGLEVRHAFAPAGWGNGYATELVHYVAQHALTSLGVAQVYAFAMPQDPTP